MNKRLNITLPEETVALLDKATDKRTRSTFIDIAIKVYVKQMRQQTLREKLKEGAIIRNQRDRELAEEWFALEE
jgi:CopG family transcriptional regulator/antitoxin EndoAI